MRKNPTKPWNLLNNVMHSNKKSSTCITSQCNLLNNVMQSNKQSSISRQCNLLNNVMHSNKQNSITRQCNLLNNVMHSNKQSSISRQWNLLNNVMHFELLQEKYDYCVTLADAFGHICSRRLLKKCANKEIIACFEQFAIIFPNLFD